MVAVQAAPQPSPNHALGEAAMTVWAHLEQMSVSGN
jgi:hypothetical protein